MGDEQNENEELEMLKMEAEDLKIKFRSDIGIEALQRKIANAEIEAIEDDLTESDEVVVESPEVEIEIESDPEPVKPKQQIPDISEGEAWVDRVAMTMLVKGHGQRNVLLRACTKAGVTRAEGYEKFTAAKGKTMRERLIAIFE